MKKNMGTADRIIRLLVAALLVTLYETNVIGGVLGIIALVVSGIFVLTSLFGFCPLYAIFGLRTCPAEK